MRRFALAISFTLLLGQGCSDVPQPPQTPSETAAFSIPQTSTGAEDVADAPNEEAAATEPEDAPAQEPETSATQPEPTASVVTEPQIITNPTPAPEPEPAAEPAPTPAPTVIAAPQPVPVPEPVPTPDPAPVTPTITCCKYCTKGKACGNTCISQSYTCHQPPGCACNTY